MRSASVIALICYMALAGSMSGSTQPSDTLQAPSAFAAISDPSERSRAIFAEAAKVLTHPRCMNCHPATDRVLQGNDKHPHQPVATRDTPCVTCHTDRNVTLLERASYRSIPGHPRWMAAPIEMAWEGKSVGEICRQIKDPDRNGGRNLSLLHEHLAHDDLVAWGLAAGRRTRPRSRLAGVARRLDPGVDRHRSPVPVNRQSRRVRLPAIYFARTFAAHLAFGTIRIAISFISCLLSAR